MHKNALAIAFFLISSFSFKNMIIRIIIRCITTFFLIQLFLHGHKEKGIMAQKKRKKQILIVEDNDINRMMLKEILADEYHILEAENGQIGLEVLEKNRETIALVLLDVMMPIMDGYTFLEKVKENKELSLIPVIIMTQSDSEEDEISALAHGAADFVPKPYRPRVILHRVSNMIKLRETAALVNQFKYDRLTGLFSKEYFYQKVKQRLEENPDKNYTIICSNLENFKLYNDSFGQIAGNQLLQDIAAKAQSIIGENGICSRYNADRFLFLQEKEQEQADRECFFNELSKDTHNKIDNVVIKWGIYEITDRSVSVEQMCDRALLAVDNIKGQYNQYYSVYNDTLRDQLLREKAISDVMESALEEGQFTVYYQPKYHLKKGCIAGAEALVRWLHPQWGVMSPGEFIPLFERNGFIPRLDLYIWQQVCIKMKEWRDKGYPPIAISVNVSRFDIYQPNFIETIYQLTQKYDIEPKYLHLEITESAYTENMNQIVQTIAQLRQLGFIVEMDDFGSGYSSLNMLSQIQLDILKLDMKFIQNEIEKDDNQSILSSVVNMAHKLSLSVIAEGVETREQLERLQEIGCDYVQGFYFAKPMTAADFEELWKGQQVTYDSDLKNTILQESRTRQIMIIDDDEHYLKKVQTIFEKQYDIVKFVDVEQALDYLKTCHLSDIAIIILSMTMSQNSAQTFLQILHQDPSYWNIPVLSTMPNGQYFEGLPLNLETDDFLCKCHPVHDLQRRVEHLIKMKDADKRVQQLQDEASQDYMTGLLNRRGLDIAISSLRQEDYPLALCLFDLDDLKIANDMHGHDKGDQLIQSFADILKQQTRDDDVQCRYGGDEFLIVFKNMRSQTVVVEKCEKICHLYKEHFVQEKMSVSCSCGIVMCQDKDRPFSLLVEYADEALYESKRKKGKCTLWNGNNSLLK